MRNYRMNVRIVGEPFLSRAIEYREKLKQCHDAWRAFGEKMGASSIPGGLTGLIFDSGKAPDGWSKPDRKHGWSRPKKGHPDEAIIAALPREPSRRDVFRGGIIEDLNYKGPDHEGYGGIGDMFNGPFVGWAGDTYFGVIPDAKQAADDHLLKHPHDTITSGADKWTIPKGLIRISEAERDLIVAEYKVSQEHAASDKAA